MFDSLRGLRCPTIIAGRYVSNVFPLSMRSPRSSQIIVIGEPYKTITELTSKQTLLDKFVGRTILGQLWNPTGIRLPSATECVNSTVSILTSIGCEKCCAYCPYGSLHRKIYGDNFSRRERSGIEVFEECNLAIRNGANTIQFVADQVFSEVSHNNEQLALLASLCKMGFTSRVSLVFNITPTAVINNRELLLALDKVFELCPTLSIESLDDRALQLFDVGFCADDAIQAVRILTEWDLAFRFNYIFEHPWKTEEGLSDELERMTVIAEIVSGLAPVRQLLLAGDLFTHTYRALNGAPLELHMSLANRKRCMSAAFLNVLKVALDTIVFEATQLTIRDDVMHSLIQRCWLARFPLFS